MGEQTSGLSPADFLDRNVIAARRLTRYAQEDTPIFDQLAEEWLTGSRPLPDVCGGLVRVPEEALDVLSRAAVGPSLPEASKPRSGQRRQPRHMSRAERRKGKG